MWAPPQSEDKHREAAALVGKPDIYLHRGLGAQGSGPSVLQQRRLWKGVWRGETRPSGGTGEGRQQCRQLYPASLYCVGNHLYLREVVKCHEIPEGEATVLLVRCYRALVPLGTSGAQRCVFSQPHPFTQGHGKSCAPSTQQQPAHAALISACRVLSPGRPVIPCPTSENSPGPRVWLRQEGAVGR